MWGGLKRNVGGLKRDLGWVKAGCEVDLSEM